MIYGIGKESNLKNMSSQLFFHDKREEDMYN